MSWYYYSGKTVRPIQIKKGLSKSIRPHRKVEILEITQEAHALIKKGELRRTSPLKGAESIADKEAPVVNIAEVVEKSEFAKKFAEKGKTTAVGIPPKTKSGKQEMTESEMFTVENGAKVDSGEDLSVEAPADGIVDAVSLPKDEESKKRKKKGRR